MTTYCLQRDWHAPAGKDLYWMRVNPGQTPSVVNSMTGPISSFTVNAAPGDTFVFHVPVCTGNAPGEDGK